jgi:putative membrane protein
MPEAIIQELWGIVPTVIYFFVGLALFGIGVFAMEKVTPFSIKKEITEDHNTSLGIIIGCALIGLAIILSAAIK